MKPPVTSAYGHHFGHRTDHQRMRGSLLTLDHLYVKPLGRIRMDSWLYGPTCLVSGNHWILTRLPRFWWASGWRRGMNSGFVQFKTRAQAELARAKLNGKVQQCMVDRVSVRVWAYYGMVCQRGRSTSTCACASTGGVPSNRRGSQCTQRLHRVRQGRGDHPERAGRGQQARLDAAPRS